jgi:hypothetical protein
MFSVVMPNADGRQTERRDAECRGADCIEALNVSNDVGTDLHQLSRETHSKLFAEMH